MLCCMSAGMYTWYIERTKERRTHTNIPNIRAFFSLRSLTSSLRYAGRLLIIYLQRELAAAGEEGLHYSSRVSYIFIACATCWMLEPHPQQLTLDAWRLTLRLFMCCWGPEMVEYESLPFSDFGRWLSVDGWWSRWSLVVIIFRRFHVRSARSISLFLYFDRTDYFLASSLSRTLNNLHKEHTSYNISYLRQQYDDSRNASWTAARRRSRGESFSQSSSNYWSWNPYDDMCMYVLLLYYYSLPHEEYTHPPADVSLLLPSLLQKLVAHIRLYFRHIN